ncbi:MAG: GNAT family N-acetyltransferase [Actinomycetota bacterium]|nr:GNAT family N-acetyltransferase [Actinomycetota bacterium]
MNPLLSVRDLVRRRGLLGTARRAAARLAPGTSWSDEYLWYALEMRDPNRPRRALPDELTLRRGSAADIPLLEQLPSDREITSVSAEMVRRRLAEGATLWLVVENGRTAFSCWNFVGHAPLSGARGNRMVLPPEVVVLEDSISSPHYRGRGVAAAAWSSIADAQAASGQATMVTKVHAENAAVRRALGKVGFCEVAQMHRSGPIWQMRTRVTLTPGRDKHGWLSTLQRRC